MFKKNDARKSGCPHIKERNQILISHLAQKPTANGSKASIKTLNSKVDRKENVENFARCSYN